MSITNFDDAIRDNVKSYSSNLDTLRANNIRQRNNALAGLQSEVEKFGEMAKLGLEIPVAIEGLKQVGKRAGDLVDFVKGAPAKLQEVRGAVDTALSRAGELYEGASERVAGAAGNIRENILAQRLDNLRRSSDFGGAGESKVDFNPIERIRDNAIRSRTGVEMTEVDDPNYFETKAGGSSFAYGDGRRYTNNSDMRAANAGGDLDEYGLPKIQESSQPSLFEFSHEEPRFSTQRGLDAGFENDRYASVPGRAARTPAPVSQPAAESAIAEHSNPAGPEVEMRGLSAKAEGEIRPGSSVERTTQNTIGEDIEDVGEAAEQTAGAEEAVSSGLSGAADAAAAATAGEVAGGIEEGVGAGLLASGIFAPIGALLEGVGAVTEVGSVGAGVYGAVQSFSEEAQAQALRKAPLPQVSQPTLDLGGRVAAPVLA